jgi:hypothetical protein
VPHIETNRVERCFVSKVVLKENLAGKDHDHRKVTSGHCIQKRHNLLICEKLIVQPDRSNKLIKVFSINVFGLA